MIIKSTVLLWKVPNTIESHRKHSIAVWPYKYHVNGVKSLEHLHSAWKLDKGEERLSILNDPEESWKLQWKFDWTYQQKIVPKTIPSILAQELCIIILFVNHCETILKKIFIRKPSCEHANGNFGRVRFICVTRHTVCRQMKSSKKEQKDLELLMSSP